VPRLRQLTATRGRVVEDGGAISVELPGRLLDATALTVPAGGRYT